MLPTLKSQLLDQNVRPLPSNTPLATHLRPYPFLSALFDDLSAQIAANSQRVKEWYGWHFPELAKLVPNALLYVRVVKSISHRSNAPRVDLESIIQDEDVVKEIVTAAECSMGSDIEHGDLQHITDLCDQLIELAEFRDQIRRD
jgi:nucleolar protein 58